MTDHPTFLIIGAGLAGAKAAEALRERGFDGRIALVGDEPERPYERPPLSKGYLTGEDARDSAFVHDAAFYAHHAIDLHTSTAVTRLDPDDHAATLADGSRLRYDKALLATGSEPQRLPVPGADLPGVHYLRTLADADALIEAAGRAGSAAVVGAGWIGAEVTASLRRRGLPVTLIEPMSVPLERVLGAPVGALYRDLHAGHGVTLRMGRGVAELRGHGHVEELLTTDGERIAADLVVAGVGARPRLGLATGAGLAVSGGVLTDEYLRTSHPDVYAAGDIASAWHPVLGTRIRVEHWANALNQGAAAAESMLGAGRPYDRVPYFFSDQYDWSMEYFGHCPDPATVVFRGDPEAGAFLAFWLIDGVVTAAMNVNAGAVGEDLERLVLDRAVIAPEVLADPDVPLGAPSR